MLCSPIRTEEEELHYQPADNRVLDDEIWIIFFTVGLLAIIVQWMDFGKKDQRGNSVALAEELLGETFRLCDLFEEGSHLLSVV